jgi:hypothetical protein
VKVPQIPKPWRRPPAEEVTGISIISASQIRPGVAIRYEYQAYKVIAADYHPGQGETGRVNHMRLKDLVRGTLWEHSSALAVEASLLNDMREPHCQT